MDAIRAEILESGKFIQATPTTTNQHNNGAKSVAAASEEPSTGGLMSRWWTFLKSICTYYVDVVTQGQNYVFKDQPRPFKHVLVI